MTAALDAVLPLLRCPVCEQPLHHTAGSLRCGSGHAFDVARQGYVTLLAGRRPHPGDTAEMVAARDRFLSAGHYATIAAAVASTVHDTAPDGPVLDLAAGTGWYAAQLLESSAGRTGVAVDVSVAALKRAARARADLAAVGADAWGGLPVVDGGFAVVLSIFGPRTAGEIARVLRPGGVAVTVTPTPDHLAEIVGPLGMLGVGEDKPARLRTAFADLEPVAARRVEYPLVLDHPALAELAGMGPAGHHQDPAAIAHRVATLPEAVTVTVSVDVTTFRRP